MASGFPGSIDSFTNPLTTSPLNSPSHAGQHQDLNDAVNKIETYMGLVKVIPTSGVGCTISATGTVTFSSGAFSVNGAFTSGYANYRVLIDVATSSGDPEVRLTLRASGTDSAANYYTGSWLVDSGGTLNFSQNGNYSRLNIAYAAAANTCSTSLDIFKPQTANNTNWNGQATNSIGSAARTIAFGGAHLSAVAYDGFTLTPSTGTWSGTVRVYGYRN
jgi:hypothetical protein